MTRCEFFTDDSQKQDAIDSSRITGFHVSGHSGYGEAGKDVVCAAVSAIVTMAETIVNDELHANAKVKIREKDSAPSVSLTLPASCDEEDAIQSVLSGMMQTLLALQETYPDYIEVLEV